MFAKDSVKEDIKVVKGEIYYADLDGSQGSEQNGIRPVLIVQNDIGNKYSPTTIIAAITKRDKKSKQPTHVELNDDCGLEEKSIVMLEQIRTLDLCRFKEKVGECDEITMKQVNKGLFKSFFMTDNLKLNMTED